MKFLFNFFPILIFYIAYQIFDIFIATAVMIAASTTQVSLYWFKYQKFETMHIAILLLMVVLGGATIAFQNEMFIKWKPTVINWIFGLIFMSSHFIGRATMIEHVLGGKVSLPSAVWNRLNLSWVIFFMLMGALNVYVAFYYGLELASDARNDSWVSFKLFGIIGLTLAFTFAQAFYFAPHIQHRKSGEHI